MTIAGRQLFSLMCVQGRERRQKKMAGRQRRGVAEDVQVQSERDRKVHRQKTGRKWNETRREKIKRKKGISELDS